MPCPSRLERISPASRPSSRDHRAGRRGGAVDAHREQPLLDEAAVFGARRQLLADIAAFLPIDAVAIRQTRLRAGSTCRAPDRGCRRGCRGRGGDGHRRRNRPALEPQRGKAGETHARAAGWRGRRAPARRGSVMHDARRRAAAPRPARPRQAKRGERAGAEHRRDRQFRPLGDLDLGAQAVDRQPPLQIGEPRRLGIEPDRLAYFDHDEIVQVLALRGQQRGVKRRVRRDLLDIVRHQPLQKAAGGPAPTRRGCRGLRGW